MALGCVEKTQKKLVSVGRFLVGMVKGDCWDFLIDRLMDFERNWSLRWREIPEFAV